MRDEKIPTVVWLCPILPFINDTEKNISGILDFCIEAEVFGIVCFGMGLTLRDGNREYFYSKLAQLFPGMKEKYIQIYGNSYKIDSPDNNNLMKLFHQKCSRYGIMHDNRKIFEYLNTFKEQYNQLNLFNLF